MADESLTLPATGFKVGVKKIGDVSVERVQLVFGDEDTATDVSPADPLPVAVVGDPSLPADAATQTTLAAVLAKLSDDPATQATLAAFRTANHADLVAVLAKLSADPATQTTLAALVSANHTDLVAILAKLSADPATQTTLAAVLAKLSADPSTGTLQTSANTKLDQIHTDIATTLSAYVDGLETLVGATNTGLASILAKLSADPATQTTLAAILAKLISGPATEAKQDSIITVLGTPLQEGGSVSVDTSLLATQTTLAAVLAKLSADPSTGTLQTSANTKLDQIHTDIATTLSAYVDGLETLVGATNTGLSSILAKLSADPATQTTLAAILAKLISAPATEAKQDSTITQVTASATILGTTADAAVVTDANGTVSAKLRGLVKRWADALGAGTAAAALRTTLASDDPAVAVLGASADAAVTAGATGSISAKLRSISRDIVSNIVLAAGSAIIGKVGIDQTTPGTTNKVIIGTAGADGSTTITTGATAQNLFSGATPTNGFEICNPDATNDLWVSDSTTAAANGTGSFRVAANGGTYTTPVGYRPIQAVSIVGAVTGQKITARRW